MKKLALPLLLLALACNDAPTEEPVPVDTTDSNLLVPLGDSSTIGTGLDTTIERTGNTDTQFPDDPGKTILPADTGRAPKNPFVDTTRN